MPPIKVQLQNDAGQPAPGSSPNVSVSLQSQSGYVATLGGTVTLRTVNGEATFSDLVVSHPGLFRVIVRVDEIPTIPADTTRDFVVNRGGALRFSQIALGGEMWYGLTLSGDVYRAGLTALGRGGNGVTQPNSQRLVRVLTTGPAKQVIAGSDHGGVVYIIGTFACWGVNSNGQCTGQANNSPILAPTLVPGRVIGSLVSGPMALHSCLLDLNGVLECGGDNQYGQLGRGVTSSTGAYLPVQGGVRLDRVTTGRTHTCGLTPGGTAYCWGSNDNGQLGNGSAAGVFTLPQVVSGGRIWSAIVAGDAFTCAIESSSAELYCWGEGDFGKLGNGSTANTNVPTRVASTTGVRFKQVALGQDHACALSDANEAYCWGSSASGRLGIGSSASRSLPARIPGFAFEQIAASEDFTCAIVKSGEAWCWGANTFGQLGIGTTISMGTPQAVLKP
jgi:alpha-tubulin suppressor-like RCC1 family protein